MIAMNLFRRTNQKQYDGPATANIDHNEWNPTHQSSSRRRSSSKPDVAAKPNSNRYTSSSYDKRQGRQSSSRSDGRRSERDRERKNVPLASGISSRRTYDQVRTHLSAKVMSSEVDRSAGSRSSGEIPRDISVNPRGTNGSDNPRPTTTPPSAPARAKRREHKPQVPMEHDGGVLCLCAIPPAKKTSSSEESIDEIKTHRFLSGGADGSVKLWEVYQNNESNNSELGQDASSKQKRGREMIPRLVRTYRGHSGYVHSIAVLGTLDGGSDSNNSTLKDDSNHSTLKDDASASQDHSDITRRVKNGSSSRDNMTVISDDAPLDLLDASIDGSVRSGSQRSGSHRSGEHNNSFGYNKQHPLRKGRKSKSRMAQLATGRLSQLSMDGSERQEYLRKRTMFVSASRDNTLRVWPIDDNGHTDYHEDRGKDPFARGMKLRGHEFGNSSIGGVLCVCAVPSLSAVMDGSDNNSVYTGTADPEQHNSSGMMEGTISAGQFCSGGSDGRIRVWDVRSALNLSLGKVPKSGMFGTVQVQCIDPDPNFVSINGGQNVAAVTSLVCTGHHHRRGGFGGSVGEVALFAGDAGGMIRRYSRMNECGAGHTNNAIWWGCTAVFAGHSHPISSMSMLSSPMLMPLLCPTTMDDVDEDDAATMLVSTCHDGSICVWDAFDARINTKMMIDSSDRSTDELGRRRIPKRSAMWEIELNSDEQVGMSPNTNAKDRVGVTSLTTLPVGTLMAAGTTDGSIRMWNVSSGLYEGAYNLGSNVQIWSLDVLSEQDVAEDYDEYGDKKIQSAGIIVSGDNRGRIRVLRKTSSRKAA